MSNEVNIKDVLYDKSYECPICDARFSSKTIKINVNRVVSIDEDLYAHYNTVNPLLYDIISCPKCGYSAIQKNFTKIFNKQIELIKKEFVPKYKKRNFPEYMSTQDAIVKHLVALTCVILKNGKMGEQAYLALHIAWLYRDMGFVEKEQIFLNRALEGFIKASTTEQFPIINLDFNTTNFIISAIACRLGKYDLSKRYLASVILESTGNLKNRALDLKEVLRDKMALSS